MKVESKFFSGIGNTFHIFYNVEKNLINTSFIDWVQNQHPADGFVFLEKIDKNKYAWTFFNNDGSVAEMCGNATRCVGSYINQFIEPSKEIFLQTVAGEIKITHLDNNVYEVVMPTPQILKHPQYFFCNTGVPHVVIEIPDTIDFQSEIENSRKIRMSPDFQPKGTNVTLVKKTKSANEVTAITFERGVEGFTQACGTGAVAAALYVNEKYNETNVSVQMPGGILKIDLKNKLNPKMQGAADLVKEYIYEYSV